MHRPCRQHGRRLVTVTVDPPPEPPPGCPPDIPHAGFADRPLIPTAHRPGVDCAADLGIVEGFTDRTFGPTVAVRRDQMASFLVRAAAHATGTDLSSPQQAFADVCAANAHFTTVNGAAAAGLARGVAEGVYAPGRPMRRDQPASFVVRLLDTLAAEPGGSPD